MGIRRKKRRRGFRRGCYRLSVAMLAFVVGAGSYYGLSFCCCAPAMSRAPESYGIPRIGSEAALGPFAILFQLTGGAGIVVGVGEGDFRRDNLVEIGQGGDVAGFFLSFQSRMTNNGVVQSRWLMLGLPPWFFVVLLMGKRLDHLARRWAASAKAMQLVRRRRVKWKRLIAERKFDANPRCRRCGYEMRATRRRCPECGWLPDYAPSNLPFGQMFRRFEDALEAYAAQIWADARVAIQCCPSRLGDFRIYGVEMLPYGFLLQTDLRFCADIAYSTASLPESERDAKGNVTRFVRNIKGNWYAVHRM